MNRILHKHEDAIQHSRNHAKWGNQNTQGADYVIVALADEVKRLDDELYSLRIAFDRQRRAAALKEENADES